MGFPDLPTDLDFQEVAAELDDRSRSAPVEMPKTRLFAEFLAAFISALERGERLPRFGAERMFANGLHVAMLEHGYIAEGATNFPHLIEGGRRLANEMSILSQRGWKQDLSEVVRMRDMCLRLSGRILAIRRADLAG